MPAPRFIEIETLAGQKLTVDAQCVTEIAEAGKERSVARITRQERDQTGYLVVLKGSAEEVRKLVSGS